LSKNQNWRQETYKPHPSRPSTQLSRYDKVTENQQIS
jgi:hypothetical protein